MIPTGRPGGRIKTEKTEGAEMKQRYDWLDLWRSLAVMTMLVFHALWDLERFGVVAAGTMETPTADAVRYLGGGSFILISGMLVLRAGRSVRRGFILFCLGLAVAVVTALAGLPVRFGILQLIGICMLLCGALREPLRRRTGPAYAAAYLLAFVGSWLLTANVTVPWRFLYPFGLRAEGFFSADYWPLLPWGFLYLLGTQLGAALLRDRAAPERRRLPAVLSFPGRHSLVIYLVHQPLLYGLCFLLFSGKN